MLDIRMPIGLMFIALGVLLGGYGFVATPAMNAVSLGYNVNLIWGAAMLAFGLLMAGMALLRPAA